MCFSRPKVISSCSHLQRKNQQLIATYKQTLQPVVSSFCGSIIQRLVRLIKNSVIA